MFPINLYLLNSIIEMYILFSFLLLHIMHSSITHIVWFIYTNINHNLLVQNLSLWGVSTDHCPIHNFNVQ